MADANRVAVRYNRETVYGVLDSPAPKMQDLRFTGFTLKGNKSTEVSEEIDDSRQIPDVIETGISAGGDINTELSYGALDEFILATLMASAWSTQVTVLSAGAMDVTALTGTYTHASGWDAPPVENQWLYIVGCATDGNNGLKKVKTIVDPLNFTVWNTEGMADETGVTPVTIEMLEQAVNGVDEQSFCFEKEFTDLSNVFRYYLGMEAQSLSIDIPQSGRVTVGITMLGKQELPSTVTVGDGSPTAVTTAPIVSSANDLIMTLVNYEHNCMFSASIEIANNLREIRCIGGKSLKEVGVGRLAVTGSVDLYFGDKGLIDEYVGHDDVNFAFGIRDALGNTYVFEIVSVKLSDEDANVDGVDTDVSESTSYEARKSPTEGITIRVARLSA